MGWKRKKRERFYREVRGTLSGELKNMLMGEAQAMRDAVTRDAEMNYDLNIEVAELRARVLLLENKVSKYIK